MLMPFYPLFEGCWQHDVGNHDGNLIASLFALGGFEMLLYFRLSLSILCQFTAKIYDVMPWLYAIIAGSSGHSGMLGQILLIVLNVQVGTP